MNLKHTSYQSHSDTSSSVIIYFLPGLISLLALDFCCILIFKVPSGVTSVKSESGSEIADKVASIPADLNSVMKSHSNFAFSAMAFNLRMRCF